MSVNRRLCSTVLYHILLQLIPVGIPSRYTALPSMLNEGQDGARCDRTRTRARARAIELVHCIYQSIVSCDKIRLCVSCNVVGLWNHLHLEHTQQKNILSTSAFHDYIIDGKFLRNKSAS
jgi:hypothetical protein